MAKGVGVVTDHIHSWEPIPGLTARYRCAQCPATGYRNWHGIVIEHKQKLQQPTEVTRRSQRHSGGRVGRDPVDDWNSNEGDPDR